MTRQGLERIYHISNEIDMWNEELNRLINRSLVNEHCKDITGEQAARITDLETKIRELIEKLEDTRNTVIKYICSIPDSLTRQIIKYRSCDLMTWREVAEMIGAGYTAESVRQIYSRYVRKM